MLVPTTFGVCGGPPYPLAIAALGLDVPAGPGCAAACSSIVLVEGVAVAGVLEGAGGLVTDVGELALVGTIGALVPASSTLAGAP